MNDLDAQLLVKKLKDFAEKEFDADLVTMFPDPFNLTALMEFQKIRNLKAIDNTLKLLLDEKVS